jgi:hypothetical protein
LTPLLETNGNLLRNFQKHTLRYCEWWGAMRGWLVYVPAMMAGHVGTSCQHASGCAPIGQGCFLGQVSLRQQTACRSLTKYTWAWPHGHWSTCTTLTAEAGPATTPRPFSHWHVGLNSGKPGIHSSCQKNFLHTTRTLLVN